MASTPTETDQRPVRNREWIAELLERAEMVEWDRFVLGESQDDSEVVEIYGWIERETDDYKDFIVARFWPGDEVMNFVTSSDRYTEELHCLWFGEDDLDNHKPCRRVEHAFGIENAVEIGQQTTLTDGGQPSGGTYQQGIVGSCVDCGGRMIETALSYGDEMGYITLVCQSCSESGRIEYERGAENPWANPSVREGVTDTSVESINWIDCPRCHGHGWIEDPLCDLTAAMNGRDTPCSECHTSGSVPRVIETDGGRFAGDTYRWQDRPSMSESKTQGGGVVWGSCDASVDHTVASTLLRGVHEHLVLPANPSTTWLAGQHEAGGWPASHPPLSTGCLAGIESPSGPLQHQPSSCLFTFGMGSLPNYLGPHVTVSWSANFLGERTERALPATEHEEGDER